MTLSSRSLLVAALLLTASTPSFAQQNNMNAAYETRLSSLEDGMRDLNGQVEQLSFAVRKLDQNVQRMQSDVDARLTKLEVTVGTLSAGAETRSPASSALNANGSFGAGSTEGTLGGLRQRDGRVTGAINAPQAPSLPEVDTDNMTPQEQYEHAFAQLRQADYDAAEKEFKIFIDEYPKDKMIENAKYWRAESLYVRGKFNDAAVGFADTFQQNPKGPKAPDSLLKLAMSLGAMKKNADACTALSELKVKYPNAPTNVKSRAGEERTRLRCS